MNIRPYTLSITSASRIGMTHEEVLRVTDELMKVLSPLPCEMCEGFWEGHREVSVAVQTTTPEDLSFVIYTAGMYGQKAVLVVDVNDQAYLVHCDGTPGREELGTWTEVPSTEGLAAWTQIGKRVFTTTSTQEFCFPSKAARHAALYAGALPLVKSDNEVYAMHGMDDGPPPKEAA